MPLDTKFYETAEKLFRPGMGTENVGPFLYSLIRMMRPQNVLEVGLGYTTPFIAQSLKDNVVEFEADKAIVGGRADAPERKSILLPAHYAKGYSPRLHAIDDYSIEGTSAPDVVKILKDLDLADLLQLHEGDFRGYSNEFGEQSKPFDLIWFDCGGAEEYGDFIQEYWSLLNEDHGLLVLHYTYWPFPDQHGNWERKRMLINPLMNEIRKQQLDSGRAAKFEVLSLLEPHKFQQGSVSMIRKLGAASLCRESGYEDELEFLYGNKPEPLRKL